MVGIRSFPFGMAYFRGVCSYFQGGYVFAGLVAGFKHLLWFMPKIGEDGPHVDEHVFQLGWFKHQLVQYNISNYIYLNIYI